jgi:plasmid maintenance system antidote protein VapI
VTALAELAPDPGPGPLELAPALGLPPGSVPFEPVRSAIRAYSAGRGSERRLLETIDRHRYALELEISCLTITHLAEFGRLVARLEALHARAADLLAQTAWLRGWPSTTDQPAVPLAIVLDGRRVGIPVVLFELRRAVRFNVDDPIVQRARRRRPARRGAAASMAALADTGETTADVALASGVSQTRVWAMLNARQPVSPALRNGLVQLLGNDQAAIVLDGIPELSRARGRPSAAVRALHELGLRAEDVAELIPVTPATVRTWLSGRYRPSPALAGALEQLVGAETAARIVALIPPRIADPDHA